VVGFRQRQRETSAETDKNTRRQRREKTKRDYRKSDAGISAETERGQDREKLARRQTRRQRRKKTKRDYSKSDAGISAETERGQDREKLARRQTRRQEDKEGRRQREPTASLMLGFLQRQREDKTERNLREDRRKKQEDKEEIRNSFVNLQIVYASKQICLFVCCYFDIVSQ
jgi:hypothetical protein